MSDEKDCNVKCSDDDSFSLDPEQVQEYNYRIDQEIQKPYNVLANNSYLDDFEPSQNKSAVE